MALQQLSGLGAQEVPGHVARALACLPQRLPPPSLHSLQSRVPSPPDRCRHSRALPSPQICAGLWRLEKLSHCQGSLCLDRQLRPPTSHLWTQEWVSVDFVTRAHP